MSGEVSRYPSTNCFEIGGSNASYCQRVNPLTVDPGEDWLFLTNVEGLGGCSDDAQLGAGNDLVQLSGPGS